MKVYISIDLEGVAGVAHGQQVSRGTDDFPLARRLMAEEANAAVRGAFAAGATEVVVNDAHGDMRNLLPDQLDPRARLLLGGPKIPQGMTQGLDAGSDIALFLGYHAAAGTADAILDHTYSGAAVYDLRINGEPWGEGDVNAAIAGHHGVPVGLVAGDDKTCEQVAKRIPGIVTVEVKQALGRSCALSLSPQAACEAIEAATQDVVARADEFVPFRPEGPFRLEVDFTNTGRTEIAAMVPGTERVGPRTLAFSSTDFTELYRVRMVWTSLGG